MNHLTIIILILLLPLTKLISQDSSYFSEVQIAGMREFGNTEEAYKMQNHNELLDILKIPIGELSNSSYSKVRNNLLEANYFNTDLHKVIDFLIGNSSTSIWSTIFKSIPLFIYPTKMSTNDGASLDTFNRNSYWILEILMKLENENALECRLQYFISGMHKIETSKMKETIETTLFCNEYRSLYDCLLENSK